MEVKFKLQNEVMTFAEKVHAPLWRNHLTPDRPTRSRLPPLPNLKICDNTGDLPAV